LSDAVIVSSRLCAPLCGEVVLTMAEAVPPPLNPSQNPTNGGPSEVIGLSKPPLTSVAAEAAGTKAAKNRTLNLDKGGIFIVGEN
jgi:hypothetical protein